MSTGLIPDHAENWTRYIEFCDSLLESVAGGWLNVVGTFTERGPGFIEVAVLSDEFEPVSVYRIKRELTRYKVDATRQELRFG